MKTAAMAASFSDRQLLSKQSVLLLLLVALPFASTQNTQDVRMPPSLNLGPSTMFYYKERANVTLYCEGVGHPILNYEWTKNDVPLNVNTGNIRMRTGVGTIDISSCLAADEGYYQCILWNSYGRTMSNRTLVQMAYLDSFPPNSEGSTAYTAPPNGHICMPCQPSLASIPAADIYWKYDYTGNPGKPVDVKLNSKIQTNPFTGSLCLTNIEANDGVADKDKVYICNVENTVLQIIHQGSHSKLSTAGNSMGTYSAILTFSTPATVLGLEGEAMVLRCFFSGNPVPTIAWKKNGQLVPQNRWTSTHEGTGLTLTSGMLMLDDAGQYTCEGSNGVGSAALIHTMQLTIQARPVFMSIEHRPHDVNVTESGTANISCSPRATPDVAVRWFKNQAEFTATSLPPKMSLSADLKTLTIVGVCKKCYEGSAGDLMAIQCNASNEHGYSFAQGYINVLVATTITSVGGNRPWIAYQNEVFDCSATKDDSTTLTRRWTYNEYTIQETEIIYMAANGSLVVIIANASDGGQSRMGDYKCFVSNGFSEAEIVYGYGNQIVQASSDAWVIGLIVGLICLLLLLLLLLLLFCCCRNNEGDSYPVDKNERKNGNIPEDELKAIGFQSYFTHASNSYLLSANTYQLIDAEPGLNATMTASEYDNNYGMNTTIEDDRGKVNNGKAFQQGTLRSSVSSLSSSSAAAAAAAEKNMLLYQPSSV